MKSVNKKSKSARNSSVQTKTVLIICAITLVGILLYGLQKENILQQIKTFTIKRHTILYDGKLFTPEFVVIHLGESVTIKNISQAPIEIAVGKHENHQILDGFQEKIIDSKGEYVFTPLERGVFDIHNHLNPKKLGTLIIDE